MNKSKFSKIISLMLALCLFASLSAFAAEVREGDASVDQRYYPSVMPFIHPPFYNVKVAVEVDEEGVIKSVKDNGTGLEGSVQSADMQEKWAAKNKPFFDRAVKAGVFEKFVGKKLDDVKAMKMEKGEVDATTGATLSGLAVKEAVINALEGKKGKLFLEGKGSLMPVVGISGDEVTLENKLPEDFNTKLIDVRHGVYNAEEDKISNETSLEVMGKKAVLKVKDLSSLKPGKYFVNVYDESGKYRAPNFEHGKGDVDEAQAPSFIVESKLSKEDIMFGGKKLSLKDGSLDNYLKNLEHVKIVEKGQEKGIEQELVGHHNTPNKNFVVMDKMGNINLDAVLKNKDGSQKELFEKGKTYVLTFSAFGYPEVSFEITK